MYSPIPRHLWVEPSVSVMMYGIMIHDSSIHLLLPTTTSCLMCAMMASEPNSARGSNVVEKHQTNLS